MLELRLPYMQGRADRIWAGCEIIGQAMRMSPEELFTLKLAAKFHDLGMLAVPDTALFRNGPLTPAERDLINEHPHLGGLLVAKAYPDFPDAVEAIWYHHERADGTGMYGLRQPDIPRMAAIVAIIGAVESMANGRPHRPPMDDYTIISEVKDELDKQFTRRAVSAFHTNAKPIIAAVRRIPDQKELTAKAVCANETNGNANTTDTATTADATPETVNAADTVSADTVAGTSTTSAP